MKTSKVTTVADLSREQMREVDGVMKVYEKKFGRGTVTTAAQMVNLTQVLASLQMAIRHEPDLDAEGRCKVITFGEKAVADACGILGAAVGACCQEHVAETATAIRNELNRLASEVNGEPELAGTADTAKAAVEKAMKP